MSADEHAARLALPGGVVMLRLRQGRPIPLPTVEQAQEIVATLTPPERHVVDEAIARMTIGDADRVETGLLDLIERTAADELMLTTNAPGLELRVRALEALAPRLA